MDTHFDIFISYSHADSDIADKIFKYLSTAGLSCFIDRKGITDSASWPKVLADSLNNSSIMLAIFSKAFNDSEQTDNEISIAANRHIPILVFRISNDDFSGVKEYFLTKSNWIQAVSDPESHFERLLNSIKILLGINHADDTSAISHSNIISDEDLSRGLNAERINDWKSAAYYYQAAARNHIPEAEYKLGMAYYFGLGVPQNWTKSIEYLNRAAASSHPSALGRLGRIFHYGIGVDVDIMKALNYYTDAAELGNGIAMKALGKVFKTGELGITDNSRSEEYYLRAFDRLYKMAVEYDDLESQFELANCYLDAEGTDYNSAEAISWYQRASLSGYAPATNALGICYCRGLGVHKNLTEGYNLQLKAAQLECRIAQWNTAYNYFNGCGTDVNIEEGYNWMLKAAYGGIAPAQCALGRYYLLGKNGVEKNIYQAKKWLLKAIESGSLDAMYILAQAYMNREVPCATPEDDVFVLSKRAAISGHTPSYISLGNIYYDKESKFFNPAEAFRWYEKIYDILKNMRENDERHFVSSNGAGGVMFKEFTLAYRVKFYDVMIRLADMYHSGIGVEKNEIVAEDVTDLAVELSHKLRP